MLTLAGALWAIRSAQAGVEDLQRLRALPGSMLALILLLCVAIYLTDLLRYRCLGLAVGARVSTRAALDASVANFFFSWVTPGSTFGAPASIYMLGRRGVPWDAAVVIAFGKAFSGVALICFVSLCLVAAGLGPEFDERLLLLVLVGGGVFILLSALLLVAAMRPIGATRVLARLFRRLNKHESRWLGAAERVTSKAIARLSQLHRVDALALLVLSHILYFGAFAGLGVVLIVAFGGEANLPALATTIVYIAFTYIAPTPGGAGFAEAMALPFFGAVLPSQAAVMMVLSFRAITLLMQIGFGLPYLLLAGGMGQAIAGSGQDDP